MGSIVDIFLKILLFVGAFGLEWLILELMSRFPGPKDSLGKPVIKIYYKKK